MEWYKNRTIMTPIITAAIQLIFLVLLNIFQVNLPFTQEQLASFMIGAWFFVVTLISGGNVLFDNNNVKAGNVWDKNTRNWVKPD